MTPEDHDRLIANSLALRALVSRLLSNVAIMAGVLSNDERAWIVRESQAVADSIETGALTGSSPERAERIKADALEIADRMFSAINPPKGQS